MPQADQSPQQVEDPKDPKPLDYAASSSQPDSAALQESGQVSSEPWLQQAGLMSLWLITGLPRSIPEPSRTRRVSCECGTPSQGGVVLPLVLQ